MLEKIPVKKTPKQRIATTDQLSIDGERRRGRGAKTNLSGRFEAQVREDFDDGWESLDELEPFKTHVRHELAKTIITKNDSPDVFFDQSINPYRGCEHGCIYCYARPTHCYLGLSAGIDFETSLCAKTNAAERLEAELSKPRYRVKPTALGTNTDPYQPIEKSYGVTRQILEILNCANHPVSVTTKSAMILRDIDLLASLASRNLVTVAISITTLDHRMSRKMEPRASTPDRRLEAIAKLSEAGIPTAVLFAPVIPAINDSELEAVLHRAAQAGASAAAYVMLRLPLEISALFQEWLEEELPNRAKHVMSLVRDIRKGKDYISAWYERHTGAGPYADLTAQRFRIATQRLGLMERSFVLREDLFTPPKAPQAQLDLFK
ncbi:MAG: PA0069 family radical SAM protein [Alphaproteobacteria bacterium]